MPRDERLERDLVQEAGDHAAQTFAAIKQAKTTRLKFGGQHGISIFADFNKIVPKRPLERATPSSTSPSGREGSNIR